ncbi:hypothetical protein MRB53_023399 [Persea americana]|uniref:Uncharacterized protein n=1 Tax=Persea americana TaxID=3435 RepID=A0ACC2L9H8_PERAE|nr:hypothetical protein MRB53_023399 [Persea americana]
MSVCIAPRLAAARYLYSECQTVSSAPSPAPTSGSGNSTTLAARRLCSEGQPGPTVLSSVPSPALAAQPFQGPVRVPPSRLGASVQRANRPELGAFTSSGGTAISGSGKSTTLPARRLCSEGQPS